MSTYLYKKEEPQDWGPTYHCNNNNNYEGGKLSNFQV